MNNFINLLMPYFRSYSVLFLSILIIIQCTGIPTGATLLVIACGAFSYAGEFNIVVVLLEVWLFSCIGDLLDYFIWKVLGERLLGRFPRLRIKFEPQLFKAQNYLERHGKAAVFLTRFLISPMAPFINAAAGIVRYNLTTFCIFVVLGEIFWSGIYVGLGYWFGNSWENLVPLITGFGQILTYGIIFVFALYLFIRHLIVKSKSENL